MSEKDESRRPEKGGRDERPRLSRDDLADDAPAAVERPHRRRSGRRMYERSDVPKVGPNSNKIAAAVLVVLAIALVVLVTNLWRLANQNSKLGDSGLADAVAAASVSADAIDAQAQASGSTVTGNQLEVVLFAVTSDADDTTLSAAYLAVINDTAGSTTLVGLPVGARVGDASASVADSFAAKGATALVSQLAAAAVPVSHVVVMTKTGWDDFLAVAQKGASALKSGADDLLHGITSSDMDVQTLVAVGQKAASSGVSAESVQNVAAQDHTAEDGSTYQWVDPAQLGLAIGTLATAQ